MANTGEELENVITPIGGMNQDDSASSVTPGSGGISAFAQGDYRYALNARIGATFHNNDGALENIPSTLEINNYWVWNGSAWVSGSPASGTNVCINKCEDAGEGRVYWAVYNSNGNHSILYFVKSEKKIYELLKWSGLNFALTNFVSMAKINKYLLLTDGKPALKTGNPPRCMDVTTVSALKFTLGSNFSEFHISLAKWPPVMPPKVIMGSVATNDYLAKGIFQFTYRYIYIGGFNSCWSPPSNYVSNELLVQADPNTAQPSPVVRSAVQLMVETYGGWIFDSNNPSNPSFKHTDARFYNFVQYIEFAYRQGANDNWKAFKKLTVAPSLPTFVTFDNSGPTRTIADSDIGQYFDSVPLLSEAIEAIDNRPMLGDNYDDLEPMADFDVTNVEVYSMKPSDNHWFTSSGLITDPLTPLATNVFPIQRFTFKDHGIYKLGIIFQHYSGRTGLVQTLDKWTYNIPGSELDKVNNSDMFHALGFKIASGIKPPDWAVGYQIVRSNCLNIDFFVKGMANFVRYLAYDISSIPDSSLSVSSDIRSTIAGYFDNYNSGSGAQYDLSTRILNLVRKNAPSAHSNRGGSRGNNPVVGFTSPTLLYFEISNWYVDVRTSASGTTRPANSVYYNWQPGDRVRISSYANNAGISNKLRNTFDCVIVTFTGTGIIVELPDTFNMTYQGHGGFGDTFDNTKNFIIEIYRPAKFSNEAMLFYEMGEWYPVVNPTKSTRDFSKKDFTWTDRTTVSSSTLNGWKYYNKFPIVNGDAWLVTKNFFYNVNSSTDTSISYPSLNSGYINSPPFSLSTYPVFHQMNQDRKNAAGFWEHNNGRPLVAYESLPVQFDKSTQVRFGGKFLENSLFIGINKFRDEDQFIYPSEYGRLRALVNTSNTQVKNVGNILLAIFEDQTVSIYINRTTLEDIAGNTQVSLSDRVLGSYNTLLGGHGTLNPESVSKKNSRVLFWNAKKGGWIRYSEDGLTVISDEKMSIWFNDLILLLTDTYKTSTPAVARSVYDPYYDEWLTFLDHSSLPSTFRGYSEYKCMSFSEREADKRWKSVMSFAPEAFSSIDNETYSIIGTKVHIHQEGNNFNYIYGVRRDTLWQPLANDMLRTMKIWQSVNVQATDMWEFLSIQGDYRSNNRQIQESTLLLMDMQELERVFWANLKNDKYTPNASSSTEGLVNGDKMRSRALTMMMRLDTSVDYLSFLNWLIVKYTISEKTVKK